MRQIKGSFPKIQKQANYPKGQYKLARDTFWSQANLPHTYYSHFHEGTLGFISCAAAILND